MSALITYPLTKIHDLTSSTLNLAKDTLVSVGGTVGGSVGLGRVLEGGLVRVMQKQIKYNRLTLILPSGKTYTFGPLPPTSTSTSSSKSKSNSKSNGRSSRTRTRTLPTRPKTNQLVGTGKYDYSIPPSDPPSTTSNNGGASTGPTSERSLDSSLVLDRSGLGTSGGEASGVSTPMTSVASPRSERLKGIYAGEGEENEDEREVDDNDDDDADDDDDEPCTPVTIKINSTTFFLRLLLSGDLGFAEAYMAGECEVIYTHTPLDHQGGAGAGGAVVAGQRLDGGYYGDVSKGLRGEKEGEELLELFKIAIRSDHPSSTSSRSYHLAHPTASGGSRSITGGLNSLPSTLFSTLGNWTTSSRIVNSVRNSVGNIKAHYDISNRMFASFLSADMTYSCAIFPELDGDLAIASSSSSPSSSPSSSASSSSSPDDSFNPIYLADSHPSPASHETTDALESAQYAKLHHIIRKAKIRRGHRVLEIGSGWGSMAIEAVRLTGCTVDTLTLSTQQKVLAEERIRKAGLEDSITVHLMDFRSIPDSWKHTFDRLVSVEMLEAVGKEYIQPYFKMIDEVLNEKGVAVFQVITIPESRFDNYSNNVDFIQKWSALVLLPTMVSLFFPGGFLPSVAYCAEMISKGSQNRLTVDSMVNIGPHYARTLREWRLRFLKNFDRDIRPALRDEHPEMTEADVEVFKRKWIYYFVYCEVGFAERLIGDHIISISREGNRTFGSDVYA